MFIAIYSEDEKDVYYVNTERIDSINCEKGEWSYTINHSRVPITNQCAVRLVEELRIQD